MAWTAEQEGIEEEDKSELMGIGAMIVTEIEKLLRTSSSKIRTDFRHGVTLGLGGTGKEPKRSAQLVLLFTITDLGNSDEAQVETFITEYLLNALKEPPMIKYKVQWAFEVMTKEGGEEDGK